MELDRSKGAPPLYFQLENILRERIESGEFVRGDLFLSEKSIQEIYNVSRITVRQAVNALTLLGYLESSRGKGTTVLRQKVEENLKQVISFSEEMKNHKIEMKTSYCTIEKVYMGYGIAKQFNRQEGDCAYRLTRVRGIDNEPMVYCITYLREDLELTLDEEAYMGSLYELLREEYGIKIVKGQEYFEAEIATKEARKYLNIDKGSAVFKRTRKTYDEKDKMIEYTVCYYPGDRYKYSVDI